MKNITIDVEVLECKSGQFTPEGGKTFEWKNALVRLTDTGQIIKLKSKVDLKSYEGKTVTLGLEIFSGQAYSAGVRVISVE